MFDQTTQNAVLDEAIAAARGGDRTKAKDKLTRYLRYDQKNEHAWLWMSAVVESDRERVFCLNNEDRQARPGPAGRAASRDARRPGHRRDRR
jgi:hypothetical protein